MCFEIGEEGRDYRQSGIRLPCFWILLSQILCEKLLVVDVVYLVVFLLFSPVGLFTVYTTHRQKECINGIAVHRDKAT